MYDMQFFRTKVGQAALASVAAMAALVALSTQIAVTTPVVAASGIAMVEVA